MLSQPSPPFPPPFPAIINYMLEAESNWVLRCRLFIKSSWERQGPSGLTSYSQSHQSSFSLDGQPVWGRTEVQLGGRSQ